MSSDNSSIQFSQIIREGLNIVDSNYNTAFAANLGEYLQYGASGSQLWKPAIDLMEGNNSIFITIYLPGVNKDSLTIDFISNYMVLCGRRDFPDFTELTDTTLVNRTQEIIYGSFERRIKLPISVVNKESVSISLSNGVMSVNIDKNIEFQNRVRISVADITEE